MKKLKWLSIVAALFFIASGCSKNGGGDIFIPDLSNKWYNKDDATNTNQFFFLAVTSNTNNSSFTGSENPVGGPPPQLGFAGVFTNHQIQFKYDNNSGAKSGKSYTGTIDDASKVITLTSSDLGNLVLEKR